MMCVGSCKFGQRDLFKGSHVVVSGKTETSSMNNASFPAQKLDLLSQNYRHFLCFHTPFLGGIEKSAVK